MGAIILAMAAAVAAAGEEGREALRGTWEMASLVINGKEAEESQVKPARLVVDDDKFTIKIENLSIPCTVKLDPEAKPKAIDMTYEDGDLAGKTVKGIYKVEGDTLVICRTYKPGDDRPAEFATGAGLVLVTWKRAKP
jgi:uncharacterized protein (TIGR03067 family)